MLTLKQNKLLQLAKANENLEHALKKEIAEHYGLEDWEKVDLRRAFEYENWKQTVDGKMDEFFRQLDEDRWMHEERKAVQMARHGFSYLSKRVIHA